MKKGISIWSFGNLSTEESLKLAKDAGFDGIELALNEEGETSLKTTDKEFAQIKKAAGGNISDLGGYYNELVYFTDCAKENKKVEKATLKDAAESLRFVLEEIENAKD